VERDDFVLFPGLCDYAEWIEVSFWGRKLKAFIVYLPVPFCLINHLLFSKTIANILLVSSLRANVSYLSLLQRGRARERPR
jgi:hypothetical protein